MSTAQAPDDGTVQGTDDATASAAAPADLSTGTAVGPAEPQAMSDRKKARAELSPERQADIARRREIAETAAQISQLSWGKEYDYEAVKMIAWWASRNAIDVETEIHVLGGRLYLNAMYFINRAKPLIERGILEYMKADHIAYDDRLDDFANRKPEPDDDAETVAFLTAMARKAQRESYRREMARIEFNVPAEATVAVVGRIKFAHLAEEFVGCKWYVPNATITIKKRDGGSYEKQKDAVGDSGYAVESVESRALRRALRLCVGQLPTGDPFRVMVERDQEEGKALSAVIAEAKARMVIEEEGARRRQFHGGIAAPDGAYAEVSAAPRRNALGSGDAVPQHGAGTVRNVVVTEPARRPSAASIAELQRPDPLGDPHPNGEPTPATPASTPTERDPEDLFGA